MRRLVCGLAIAGATWLMLGCGGVAVRNAATKTLQLSDSADGTKYELGVADGALTLTGTSGTAGSSDPALTDVWTGSGYRVGVVNGSLTLEAGGTGSGQIGLVDSVTAQTFALAVEGGALALVEQDGGVK